MSLIQVGVVDVADEEVVKKGRLMPGNIFLVDFDEHRVVEDKEVRGRNQGAWENVRSEVLREDVVLSQKCCISPSSSSLEASAPRGQPFLPIYCVQDASTLPPPS